MFFESLAYAMAPPSGGAEGGNPLTALMPLVLMFVIFYFLLIRPQQKKAKQHKELLQGLKRGDHILTSGGLYGRIVDVKDDVLSVDLGNEMVVKINRSFISTVPDAPKESKKDKSKSESK